MDWFIGYSNAIICLKGFLVIKYCCCDQFCIVNIANPIIKLFANHASDNLILFTDNTPLVQKIKLHLQYNYILFSTTYRTKCLY